MSSITISLKEPSSVMASSTPAPLFSKFKSRTKDVESPKSVILDPRIVSPTSSASASLERRLTDMKKPTRHDRVHSISDAEEENTLPSVNLSTMLLTRQLSSKGSNGHLLLDAVAEVHSISSVPGKMGHISAASPEASSPRNKLSRNASNRKDGAKGYERGSEGGEFVNRRMSFPGTDITSSTVTSPQNHLTDHHGGEHTQSFTCSPAKSSNHGESDRRWRNATGFRDARPIPSQTLAVESVRESEKSEKSEGGRDAAVETMYNLLMNSFNGPNFEEVEDSGESISGDSSPEKSDPEFPLEDQIEFNKFVVRDNAGEDIKHKIAWSPGHREHRNSLSGDGRTTASGFRQPKFMKTNFSPAESPGHPNGFNELDVPRSALEFPSDFVTKTASQGVRDARSYLLKSASQNDSVDRLPPAKAIDGWRRSVDNPIGSAIPFSLFGADSPPAWQSHAGIIGSVASDGNNIGEKRMHFSGKAGGTTETSKISSMPQQRYVPGQFLTSNPLKPRPPPAKWDDAEKWLSNPASVKNGNSQNGNGGLSSGNSTPQHVSQIHAAASVRSHHHAYNPNQSTRMMPSAGDSISYDARFPSETGDHVSEVTFSPTKIIQCPRSYDTSSRSDRHDEGLPVDTKMADLSNRDENGTRPEDKFANSVTVQTTSATSGRMVIVMKDAATEITPSTSQRDIATQVTPEASFHAPATPPRIHATGSNDPARLNTTPVHSERRPASVGVDVTELQNCHQAKLELDQAATLDTNWTTREEEVEESAKSLRLSVSRSVDFRDVKRNVLEARASAWEEAEQSKHMARYHREEAKILAWEAHQKAKAEACMRKMEVKLERMRSHANEQLQNRLASVHLRAENMRASAAVECGEQAVKINQWAQDIAQRRSPSPPAMVCCFPRFNTTSCSPPRV